MVSFYVVHDFDLLPPEQWDEYDADEQSNETHRQDAGCCFTLFLTNNFRAIQNAEFS